MTAFHKLATRTPTSNLALTHGNAVHGIVTHGTVQAIKGSIIIARLPQATIGDLCIIRKRDGDQLKAQVITFDRDSIFLAPFGDIHGVFPGSVVTNTSQNIKIEIPSNPRGLVIDALGKILCSYSKESKSSFNAPDSIQLSLYRNSPNPLQRHPIKQPLVTGVRSIDSLCSIGHGQRIGLFAGPGVGKSSLLAMMARNADVDVSVIALIGERGREVREFIEEALGEVGIQKAVVVVETSDQPALRRALAAVTATSIAEHFRNSGKKVLLIVDSLTRMARAIRDVSLASGEIPIRQGLTPSVYSELPKLLERAGNNDCGSISAIYSLLDSSEHELDPLAEEIKSLLDGHISLNNSIAINGIRPAIDFTRSISRLNTKLNSCEMMAAQEVVLKMIARLKKDKDILILGGIPDKELRVCLELEEQLLNFLKQEQNSSFCLDESRRECLGLAQAFRERLEVIV